MRNALAFLAIVVVVMAGTYATEQWTQGALDRRTRVTCQKVEKVIAALNTTDSALRHQREILHTFAVDAEAARLAAWKHSHQPSDLLAAHQYGATGAYLAHQVVFAPVPEVFC